MPDPNINSWIQYLKKHSPSLYSKYPQTYWEWYIQNYPQNLNNLIDPYVLRQLDDIYRQSWAQIGKGNNANLVGRQTEIGAWTPPQAVGTTQVPSTLGGDGSKMIAPDVIQTATGYETPDGLPLSNELAQKMFSDYWQPKGSQDMQKYLEAQDRNNSFKYATVGNNLDLQNQLAVQFEQERQSLQSGVTGPRDWIKAWELNNQKNPFAYQPTEGEYKQRAYYEAQQTVKDLENIASAYKTAISSGALDEAFMANPDRKYQMQSIINQYGEAKKKVSALDNLNMAERAAQGMSYTRQSGEGGNKIEGGMNAPAPGVAPPTTPPTPSWLKEIYPQLGTNITPQPIAPLSGQQWLGMPESNKQGWMGFAEYSGAVPMDLLSQMQMMQPNTPVGAGRTSWRPAKQRGTF